MPNLSPEQLFRQAAEDEGAISISAGARVAHMRLALESGRAVNVDLSPVPEGKRSALVNLIREMVRLAAAEAFPPSAAPSANPAEAIR